MPQQLRYETLLIQDGVITLQGTVPVSSGRWAGIASDLTCAKTETLSNIILEELILRDCRWYD